MARSISNDDPSQADHRFIAYCLKTFYGDQNILPDPKGFDRVGDVFEKMGGSWQRLFQGSSRDVLLIKAILQVAIKKDYLKKEPQFR
jgi:hypothetical protein